MDVLAYRVVEIAWQPRTAAQWSVFTASRLEAACCWNDMVTRHARIRRLGARLNNKVKWPTFGRWMRWVKGRYPAMSAQSAQQAVGEFLEAVSSCAKLRRKQISDGGAAIARYPWRLHRYRDVTYTNQCVGARSDLLRLSNGRGNEPLRVKLPRALPGRIVEVTVAFGVVRVVCEITAPSAAPTSVIGVDLGVNTLVAAGDGERAVLVSGREAKATIQWRAKNLASISAAQSTLTKGSRRWRRLQRRKHKMLDKAASRIKDITHKATRAVTVTFPGATVVVGKPFNDAAQKMGRGQAQQVSSACNAKIIAQLAYKMNGAREVDEHYTSQTCPVCGERRRMRRVYRCSGCGFEAPRDVVGLTNIRSIGLHGEMVFPAEVPKRVVFVRPLRKYPGARLQVVPGDPRQVARRAA